MSPIGGERKTLYTRAILIHQTKKVMTVCNPQDIVFSLFDMGVSFEGPG
jgi:hypothetical protein